MKLESYYSIMPNDLNSAGIIFGGVISSEVDKIASILAKKFFNSKSVVTIASYYHFVNPAYSGETLKLIAELKSVGEKSIGIKVSVFAFKNLENNKRKVANCYLVFGGIDENGNLIKNPSKEEDEVKEFMKKIGKLIDEKNSS